MPGKDTKQDLAIHWLHRLEIADERLKELEKYPVCNKTTIDAQLRIIARYESNVESAIRGY